MVQTDMEDPEKTHQGMHVCAVCSQYAEQQILENKGKVRINLFQLLV